MQVVSHTSTRRVERGGLVLVSFFGNLGLGEAASLQIAEGSKVRVASLLDIPGTKVPLCSKALSHETISTSTR